MGKQHRHTISGGGGDPNDNKHEQKLQAVLFADSFIHTFRPVTLDPKSAKVLCPLNNVTMLDYSIEFLAGAGVEEIFVFCVHGADEVERYVHQSSWSSILQVHCVKDASCANSGDALRELDKRGLIRSDPFVLMSGDVITNVDLRVALEAHARRRKADSSAIMTMLLKRVGEGPSSTAWIRSTREDLVVGLHPQTHRILVYDDRSHKATIQLPCDFFQACNSTIEIRNDLMPIGLDICSPEVLARFSDEFDYRHIYKQFVHDTVAEEEEGLQSKIYAHVLNNPSEYGARIVDFRTYHAVSRDIIRRWCYPVGVDNLPSGYEKNYKYVMQRHFVYREVLGSSSSSTTVGTKIARSTQILSDTIVGANVQIGENCVVQGTVIGNGCEIGHHVSLKDCHLWQKVYIFDNVTIVGCILCDGVVIRSGATLGTGCIIGKGCIIGENVVIPPFTRITMSVKDDEDDEYGDDAFSSSEDEEDTEDENEEKESDDEVLSMEDGFALLGDKTFVSDHSMVGKDGVGRVWNPPAPGDESDYESGEEGDVTTIEDIHAQSIGYDAVDFINRRIEQQRAQEAVEERDMFSEDEEEEEDEGSGTVEYMKNVGDNNNPTEMTFHNNNSGLNEDGFAIMGRQKGVDVVKELKLLCLEHDKGRDVTYLAIELNSFKFSQNASYSDCCTGAILAVLELANLTIDKKPLEVIKKVEMELKYWLPLFKKLSQGIEEERAIINAIESVAVGNNQGELAQVLSKEPAFRCVLQKLHDMDIISEEAILAWAAERRRDEEDDDTNPLVKLFSQPATQGFLDWLEEETESDDDDDNDDDDD